MSPPGSASSNSKGLQAGQLNRGRSAGGGTAGAGVTAGRAGSPSTATATGAGGVGVPFKGGVYNQSGAPALSPLLVLGQGKAGMPSRQQQQQQLMMMQQGGGNGAYGVFGNTGGELQSGRCICLYVPCCVCACVCVCVCVCVYVYAMGADVCCVLLSQQIMAR